MAITDVVAKAIVQMTGDASDLKATIREVNEEEKKYADAQLARQQKLNQGHQTTIDMLGQVGAAIGTANAAVEFGARAWQQYVEHQRLATQAGKVDLEGLAAAAGMTKTRIEILSDTAKLQTGTFKLSQAQLEMVERAMRQLTRETGNADEVAKKVTESIVKLEGDALKDYGIRVREAHDDTEKFNAIMEALTTKSGQLRDSNATAAESFAKVKASFADVKDTVVDSLGKMVAAMAPMLESLGKTVGYIAELSKYSLANTRIPGTNLTALDVASPGGVQGISTVGDLWGRIARGGTPDQRAAAEALARSVGQTNQIGAPYPAIPTAAQLASVQPGSTFTPEQYKTLDEASKKAAEEAAKAAQVAAAAWAATREGMHARFMGSGTDRELTVRYGVRRGSGDDLDWSQRIAGVGELGSAYQRTDEYGRPVDEGAFLQRAIRDNESERLTASWNERMNRIRGIDTKPGAGIRAAQKSQFQQMFGTVDEINAYRTAFDGLTGAFKAGFGAWIDGNKSAAQAGREFTKEFLKQLALQALTKAAYEGAEAIASYAAYDPVHGSAHVLAAVKYAAVATLAGVTAHELGGGGANTASTSVPPDSSASAAASSMTRNRNSEVWSRGPNGWERSESKPPGAQPIIIVQGDPHALDSPRNRASSLRRAMSAVFGGFGVAFR